MAQIESMPDDEAKTKAQAELKEALKPIDESFKKTRDEYNDFMSKRDNGDGMEEPDPD
jgi:hypothetical protein